MFRAILLLLTLASCAGPDFASTCQSYGFTPGTEGFSNCVMQSNLAYRQRLATVAAGL